VLSGVALSSRIGVLQRRHVGGLIGAAGTRRASGMGMAGEWAGSQFSMPLVGCLQAP
jgi:hypothetical protein